MSITWRLPAILTGLFVVAGLLQGCGSLIAGYSLEAYKNATTLKAETAALIDKSGESYSSHKAEVEALNTRINAAYEFAAGIPHNELTAAQWQILRDPNRDLYGGYIRDWSRAKTVSPAFREAKKIQIGRAFDFIICLEANKQAAQQCSTTRATVGATLGSVASTSAGGQR